MGSRNAPSLLWSCRRRATQPSSRSVNAAAAKTISASPGRRYTSSETNTGISKIRSSVSQLASPMGSAQSIIPRMDWGSATR